MMQKYQLAQLDKCLRVAKRVSGVPFGGGHVVLIGDFLQLPPVGGEPMYKVPSRKTKFSHNELAGYQLWRAVKDVFILKECVRFQKDPEWGCGCHKARLGIWTPEFISIVTSRVITSESPLEESMRNTVSTFVTPNNSTRLSINNLFVPTAAKLLPEGEYPVRVVSNFKGRLKALHRSEVRMIMQLLDTKFGRLAPYLDLIIGMPIQVTQNVRAAKIVANIILGRLEAIVYHPGTTFQLVHDSTAGVTVKVPSILPPEVIVRVLRGPPPLAWQGARMQEFSRCFSIPAL
ncbi:hypothetical protein PHMEG_0009226 [Phytophthora megakarya]|uniref:ATP-dependent DNA helicase n=1 Tax=Phytophthora megakarya TaxID=4795 RepID=A0A225WGR2_9STRA|nr:hypothetical protein PHMEG_0009226 [Phytophthora megakarya]